MRNVVLVAALIVSMGAVAIAGQFKIGGPVNVPTPTRISELYAVTNGDPQHPDQTVRFQAEHDGKIVFPITMKGGAGSFQGEFVKIGANDHEAKEAAAEHAHSDPKSADFGSKYQIKVTGAVVTTRD